ncbi:hypothetical protein GCM10009529_01730 [Micropruina glycogenica]
MDDCRKALMGPSPRSCRKNGGFARSLEPAAASKSGSSDVAAKKGGTAGSASSLRPLTGPVRSELSTKE